MSEESVRALLGEQVAAATQQILVQQQMLMEQVRACGGGALVHVVWGARRALLPLSQLH